MPLLGAAKTVQPGFAQWAADWRSGPRWSILSVLCPVHPFATTWHFAPVGSMSLDSRVAGLPYESSSFATSRGNEKIGGTGYCVTYDTDSQSRNADFISIARRAIRNPRGQRPRQTSQPSGRSPVNPHTEGVSKNLILSVRSRRRVFFRLFRLPRRRPGLPGGSRGGR